MLHMILLKTLEHLFVSFSSLLIATSIALPLGLYLTRCKSKRIASLMMRIFSLIQTIPGLAMIALIVALLSSLQFFGVPTTGYLPGILSLSLYGISPILTNTYTGIMQTSPAMLDVAQGLGMRDRQILFMVQLPHAIPMIMAGVRIAGVWTIGMCTLASLVGSGGLGDLILRGLHSLNPYYLLAGTLPAVFLAIFFDWGMVRLEKWLDKDERA